MKRASYWSSVMLLMIGFLSFVRTSSADEGFYESLPEVTVGKVFFSPQQRAALDQRRGGGPAAASKSNGAAKNTRRKTSDDAAGFITSSKGTSKVYTNGDFVSVQRGVDVKFPGSVKIVRGDDSNEGEAGGGED